MSRKRVILGGIAWLMACQCWSWLLRLVEAATVPRILGASGVGVVGFVGTFFAIVGLVTTFGGPEYIVRSVAADPEKGAETATHMLAARVFLLLPILCGVAVLSPFIFRHNPAVLILIPISLITAFLQPINEVLIAWRQGHSQFGAVARAQMIAQSVGLPSGIALVCAGWATRGAVIGSALIQATSWISIWLMKNNPIHFVRISAAGMGRMARGSWPYLRYNLLLWLYGDSTSVLFITWLAGFSAVGCYLLAGKLLGVLFVIPTTVIQAITPGLTRAYETSRAEYEQLAPRFVNLILVLSVVFGALLILEADNLLRVLHYPRSLYPTASLIKLMGLCLWTRWAGVCYGSLLVISGRPECRARVATLATPYNLGATLLYVVLAQRYFHNAAFGAVLGTETTEVLIVLLYMRHFRETGLVRRNLQMTARALVAVAAPVALLEMTPVPNLAAFLAISTLAVALFVPAAVATGALPKEAVALVQSAAARRFATAR